jgi:ABC-type Fe3+ transport system permease subunit
MKWIQLISTLLIQYSVQQKRVKEAPEKIKGMSIQAAIYFLGLCFFIVLSLASIIMVFADLGHQWDNGETARLSGTIQASLWMTGLGILVFGLCVLLAKYLARKPAPDHPAPDTQTKGSELNPLALFGEEFLAQLLAKLK